MPTQKYVKTPRDLITIITASELFVLYFDVNSFKKIVVQYSTVVLRTKCLKIEEVEGVKNAANFQNSFRYKFLISYICIFPIIVYCTR